MSRLAQRHRVFHVDFGPESLRGWVHRARRSPGGLDPREPFVRRDRGVTVLDFWSPAVAGRLPRGHPVRSFLEYGLRVRWLARHLRRAGVRRPIVWVYHPGYGPVLGALDRRLLVYDCVDEYSEFPEYREPAGWIAAREARLCREADLVFTTSETLHRAKRPLRPEATHFVENVGDAEHFGRALRPETKVPSELATLPRPVFGFVGAVSGYKVNLEWLSALADARPDGSVVLIGPVGVADPHTDLSALRERRNVHLLGQRPYAELPAFVKGFDVALIPYRINAFTRFSFPIKFFELLGSGRPVVISALPALGAYHGAVRVADDAHGFVAACSAAAAAPEAGREARVALAQRHSWPVRVAALWGHVEARLAATAAEERAPAAVGG
jgi:glycosyltransferase involved in cell wall biosynthesis